jgi:penicillin-insensitive murein endopeptidase
MRLALALAAALLGIALPAPLLAQENRAQEAARQRAQLVNLRPDAARRLFFEARTGARLQARAIGAYGRGCLAGGVQIPDEGPGWQTMRPFRNRAWAHPVMASWLQRFAREAAAEGWPGLLIGDISQPRGGPMLTGHASHQLGIEADIWLTPAPRGRRLTLEEREEMSAVDMVRPDLLTVHPDRFTDAHYRLLRRAALSPGLDRIFVNAAIKRAMCERAPANDRAWLGRIRPWTGHTYHFHVALDCPPDSQATCTNRRAPPPPGDGCGADLERWFQRSVRFPPPRTPGPPAPEPGMAYYPAECRQVIAAP